jgi:hypothetical protein
MPTINDLELLQNAKARSGVNCLGPLLQKAKDVKHLKYLILQSVESSKLKRLETFMSLNIFSPQN